MKKPLLDFKTKDKKVSFHPTSALVCFLLLGIVLFYRYNTLQSNSREAAVGAFVKMNDVRKYFYDAMARAWIPENNAHIWTWRFRKWDEGESRSQGKWINLYSENGRIIHLHYADNDRKKWTKAHIKCQQDENIDLLNAPAGKYVLMQDMVDAGTGDNFGNFWAHVKATLTDLHMGQERPAPPATHKDWFFHQFKEEAFRDLPELRGTPDIQVSNRVETSNTVSTFDVTVGTSPPVNAILTKEPNGKWVKLEYKNVIIWDGSKRPVPWGILWNTKAKEPKCTVNEINSLGVPKSLSYPIIKGIAELEYAKPAQDSDDDVPTGGCICPTKSKSNQEMDVSFHENKP